jgi:hypothetical protein
MIEGGDVALFERSLQHATSNHTGGALDAALDQLGWRDAMAADARAAVSLLFELQGTANVTSAALDQLLAHALGYEASAVVLPAVGRWSPPGTVEPARLDVDGVGTASLDSRQTALVVAHVGESPVGFEIATAALSRRPINGVDPSLGLVEVRGEAVDARERGPVDWRAAVTLGQLALGHELVGASRRMLELARQHALDRIQFGQPIAKFQAIRHRLAETLVAVDAAQAMLEVAWLDHASQTAAMAKACAGRGARVAARHCQQVLAGIGFTTEHSFHRYLRRVLVLEQLLGATGTLTRELGRDILERRQLPALVPL